EMPGLNDSQVVEQKNRADRQNHRSWNHPVKAPAVRHVLVDSRFDLGFQIPSVFFWAVVHCCPCQIHIEARYLGTSLKFLANFLYGKPLPPRSSPRLASIIAALESRSARCRLDEKQ